MGNTKRGRDVLLLISFPKKGGRGLVFGLDFSEDLTKEGGESV